MSKTPFIMVEEMQYPWKYGQTFHPYSRWNAGNTIRGESEVRFCLPYENIVRGSFLSSSPPFVQPFFSQFFTSSQISALGGFSVVNSSFPWIYILYIILYCFILLIRLLLNEPWRTTSPGHHFTSSWSSYWLRFFWCPPRFQVV